MGLDEFLIAQDSPPSRGFRSQEDLDEAIVPSPVPFVPPGSEGPPGLNSAARPAATSPPAGGEGRWTSRLHHAIDRPIDSIADTVLAPFAIGLFDGQGPTVPSSSPASSMRASGRESSRVSTATAPEFSSRLGEFLATAFQAESATVPKDIELFDGDAASPATAMENNRGFSAPPAAVPSGPGGGWAGLTSPGPMSPPSTGLDAASDDDGDGLAERLAMVADRLERATERLASPSLPLGSRPRAFRGRIDG